MREPPTCWQCTKSCDHGYRKVNGIETNFHDYYFCSVLCLLVWAVEWYLPLARAAEKKRKASHSGNSSGSESASREGGQSPSPPSPQVQNMPHAGKEVD